MNKYIAFIILVGISSSSARGMKRRSSQIGRSLISPVQNVSSVKNIPSSLPKRTLFMRVPHKKGGALNFLSPRNRFQVWNKLKTLFAPQTMKRKSVFMPYFRDKLRELRTQQLRGLVGPKDRIYLYNKIKDVLEVLQISLVSEAVNTMFRTAIHIGFLGGGLVAARHAYLLLRDYYNNVHRFDKLFLPNKILELDDLAEILDAIDDPKKRDQLYTYVLEEGRLDALVATLEHTIAQLDNDRKKGLAAHLGPLLVHCAQLYTLQKKDYARVRALMEEISPFSSLEDDAEKAEHGQFMQQFEKEVHSISL